MKEASAPLRPQKKKFLNNNFGNGKCASGCSCDEPYERTEVTTDRVKNSELHPMDDEEVANEDAPEVENAEPPPANPEDVDGNWARPASQRAPALPKPTTPTPKQSLKY